MTCAAQLILASASPRRKELLAQIGIRPSAIVSAEINETAVAGERPAAFAARMASEKARNVAETHSNSWIIAADTVVASGRRILGKPGSEADARMMLRLLSGRRHRVVGGIAVISPSNRLLGRTVETTVSFKRLQDSEIAWYLAQDEWPDKAGAYAIQGAAAVFVKRLSGSYSNVVGLSLYDTWSMLCALGWRGGS